MDYSLVQACRAGAGKVFVKLSRFPVSWQGLLQGPLCVGCLFSLAQYLVFALCQEILDTLWEGLESFIQGREELFLNVLGD